MYEKEYEKLIEFIVKEFSDEINKGQKKRGESAAMVAIRLLKEYKSLVSESVIRDQLIDLEQEKKRLIEKMDILTSEIQNIDHQLSSAILNKLETGEYADPKWFVAAKNAKKAKRAEIIKIQRRLHMVNSKIKDIKGRTYERLFVEAAKDALTREQYSAISSMAFSRMGKIERYEEV